MVDKKYQSYYTKEDNILTAMVSDLDLRESDTILEPAAGDGVFVQKILGTMIPKKIDAFDIDPNAIVTLEKVFKNTDLVNIFNSDTLLDNTLDEIVDSDTNKYTKIIGNPPWGAWNDISRRKKLALMYPEAYSNESYSLFLSRCLDVLKDNGRLCFIIPDTFLYTHNETSLREKILTQTKIISIKLFPSKLFPGVSFGYSKICIITLEKKENIHQSAHYIKIYTNINDSSTLLNLKKATKLTLKQSDVFNNNHHAFLFSESDIVNEYLLSNQLTGPMSRNFTTLGELADCVTGIYTGDNKKFLKVKNMNVRFSKGYSVIREQDICYKEYSNYGFSSETYIPLVKGSADDRYVERQDNWFINWSTEAIQYYKNNNKARFQNPEYYFKPGIAFPMLKSKSMAACIMRNRVFDQSIVGVFPKNDELSYYLLAVMNSHVFRDFINTINPTSNNSANYLKRVPIPIIGRNDIRDLEMKVKKIINKNCSDDIDERSVDSIVTELYRNSLIVSNEVE